MFFIRNIRAVIIASLAIPASIISSFTLMRVMGFTLNNMTLLGITLAVGIVIDDAIVVLENIFRYIEEKNVTPYEAAIQGTREVALAVMATTLSLVVIFLPIAFMNGYAKRFINPFGWTMAFSILVSMLVSFTLTPMLSSRFLKLSDALADHKTKEHGIFHWMDQFYSRQVHWALDHPGVIIAVSVVTFLLTFPLNRMVGRDFVPNEDMGEWTVAHGLAGGHVARGDRRARVPRAERPAGHRRGRGDRTDRQSGRQRRGRRRRRRIGDALPFQLPGAAGRRPQAFAERDHQGSAPAAGEVSGEPAEHLGAQRAGQRRGAGRLRHLGEHPRPRPASTDRRVRCEALDAAQHTPSLTEPKLSLSVSNPEIHVAVDRRRAADLGVRMSTIGNTLRLAVAGDDRISFYKEGQEQYPVKVRVLENQRRDAAEIGRLTVPSATGPVRIDNIARIERGLGPERAAAIEPAVHGAAHRGHRARGMRWTRRPTTSAKMFAGLNMPGDMTFRLQGQSKILDETTANLIMAIGLAMIFVYMVLASQFESFIQPIVIMLVLPIAVPFALFTLWVTGRTLNLWSALGMLLLLGIVKKNSILQVDYANTLRAEGMPLREAIVEACRTRLRPILMTTFAIIAGLIPTALGLGIGGTGRAAIAVTVIGGQSLCLFLTLLLVPVAYVKFDALEQTSLNKLWRNLLAKIQDAEAADASPERSTLEATARRSCCSRCRRRCLSSPPREPDTRLLDPGT